MSHPSVSQSPRSASDCQDDRPYNSLADAFEELRHLCEEENYDLEISPRWNRKNTFTEETDDVSVRYEYH